VKNMALMKRLGHNLSKTKDDPSWWVCYFHHNL